MSLNKKEGLTTLFKSMSSYQFRNDNINIFFLKDQTFINSWSYKNLNYQQNYLMNAKFLGIGSTHTTLKNKNRLFM